jgi:hypothetical protein
VPEPSRARPPRTVSADTGRADPAPGADATADRGSPPAGEATAADPRAGEARARPGSAVSGAPDFGSAVAGYRAWQLGPGGVLFPLALPATPPWDPEVNRARCFGPRHDAHEAPAPHCGCGFHALHDPADTRLELEHPAVGAIAAWGEIEVYAAGFRAEYASVIALARRPSRSPEPPALLREAARCYGVRIVPFDRLEAEAREFALPLPDEALPKASTRGDLSRSRPSPR